MINQDNIITTLKNRFQANPNRHSAIDWKKIQAKLEKSPKKLASIYEMERTGGQPDVVGYDQNIDEYLFIDCSPETPFGRTSLCYDQAGLDSRKEAKPKNSAAGMASEMGIELLTEDQYKNLQKIGEFDTKTSSWLKTPPEIRKLGGALFADRRYDHVFIYHNSAPSYYASRGFRGSLTV